MFAEFFKFEFRSRLRQPMTYIVFLLNFLLVLGAICSDNLTIGGSTGNGFAERAVQSVEEMSRVHKRAVESRVTAKLPCAHPLMAWLVEHAADVLDRCSVGRDGRTPYQRLKG